VSAISKKTFHLRDNSISYLSLDVFDSNAKLDDFKPKRCSRCNMFNDFLDLDQWGICKLCRSVEKCEL